MDSLLIKELITWGTLDPVAAFLLARGDAIDRPQAEQNARSYYDGLLQDIDANDALDPRRVRDWVDARRVHPDDPVAVREFTIEGQLVRPAADFLRPHLTVSPLEFEDGLIWIDPAGYAVAESARPLGWPEHPSSFDFELNVASATVVGEAYLRYG